MFKFNKQFLNFNSAGKKEAVFLDDKTAKDRNTVNKAWKDVTKLGTVNKDKYGYNENILVSESIVERKFKKDFSFK